MPILAIPPPIVSNVYVSSGDPLPLLIEVVPHLVRLLRKPPGIRAAHADDKVHESSRAVRALAAVEPAGPLVGVMVRTEHQVHLVVQEQIFYLGIQSCGLM